jgi:hypothetical protein
VYSVDHLQVRFTTTAPLGHLREKIFVKGIFVVANAIDHGFQCGTGFDHSSGHHQPLVSTIF